MHAVTEQFLQLEQQLMHYRKADFLQLLSDEFLELGSSGGRMDKNFQIENVTEEGLEEILFTITNFEARPLAESLVQTLFVTENNETGKRQNRSSLWRLEHGVWRMYFHQGTPTF